MTPLPKTQELLKTLVGTPSMSSVNPEFDVGNREVSQRLATYFADLGCKIELMEVEGHKPKTNVIATIGQGPGGLVLAGHTDTVPFDQKLWKYDPFAGSIEDHKFFGLGSCDMKGFFVAVITAIQTLDLKKLKQPVILLATADEESGMSGAKKLLHEGRPQARYAVIGEPTNNQPIRMHKGILMESIRLLGSSGHSSDPALGRNALEGMHHVINALMKYREGIQQQHSNNEFAIPHPTLNFGSIKGGDNPNRICGDCELHLDARLVPGLTLSEVRSEIRRLATEKAQEFDLEVEFKALFDGIEPMETPASSHIVRACEALTGFEASSVDFATEGPFLTQLGMETVIMGPGDIALAHQPNEYLELQELDQCRQLLQMLIQKFCMNPMGA